MLSTLRCSQNSSAAFFIGWARAMGISMNRWEPENGLEALKTGLLDADVYGPSAPLLAGLPNERPPLDPQAGIVPPTAHGIKIMSMGLMADQGTPLIWRGPMVQTALYQMLRDVVWGTEDDKLDVLVIDLPPGTGDVQLTLTQNTQLAGAVIVTTPQDIATLDARKGLAMFRKVNIPVFGVIENMATHICSNCGHEEAIFGEGGAERIVQDFDVPLLGRLPLDARIREQTDSGKPTVVAEPDSTIAQAYREAAWRIGAAQAAERVDHSAKFGSIVVEEAK